MSEPWTSLESQPRGTQVWESFCLQHHFHVISNCSGEGMVSRNSSIDLLFAHPGGSWQEEGPQGILHCEWVLESLAQEPCRQHNTYKANLTAPIRKKLDGNFPKFDNTPKSLHDVNNNELYNAARNLPKLPMTKKEKTNFNQIYERKEWIIFPVSLFKKLLQNSHHMEWPSKSIQQKTIGKT